MQIEGCPRTNGIVIIIIIIIIIIVAYQLVVGVVLMVFVCSTDS